MSFSKLKPEPPSKQYIPILSSVMYQYIPHDGIKCSLIFGCFEVVLYRKA